MPPEEVKSPMTSLSTVFSGAAPDDAPETGVAEATPLEEKSAVETKPETKPEVSPVVEAKPEAKPTPVKEEAKPEGEAKPAEEAKPKEEPSRAKNVWESDENPYKKRYKDAGDYATRVNRDNLDLKRQLDVINKKLDGTYDPEKDAIPEPTAEEVAGRAELVGRARASLEAAYQLAEVNGEDKTAVDQDIEEFDRLFGNNPIADHTIRTAANPVLAARRFLKEYRFVEKFGRDPDKIIENVRKALIDELTPKIREEESQKLMARLEKKGKEVAGIGAARGSGDNRESKPIPVGQTPLGQIFSH